MQPSEAVGVMQPSARGAWDIGLPYTILFSALGIGSVDLSLRLPQEFVRVGHIACGSDSNSSYYHFSDLKW